VLTLAHALAVLGALFVGAAVLSLRDRRWASAGFWAILAVPLLVGDSILAAAKAGTAWPAQLMGVGVIALAVLAVLITRQRTPARATAETQAARDASAARLGNWLFAPAIALPALMIVLLVAAPHLTWSGRPVIDPAQASPIALVTASVLALAFALALTRSRPIHGLGEGRRLLDTIGWAVALPLMLATLGTVFNQTGVGAAVAHVVGAVIPTDSRVACVLAYGLGMILFTVIMGNAFAAFPVMTAGIGLPLLVRLHHADPAALGAIGMLTGYCGTLLTPMAANFNIVPVLLLDLDSEYGVIRLQWPTALVLAAFNLILMIAVV
jgi:uncharacterized membrane protein